MLRFSKWSLSWTDNSEAADDRPWSSSGRNHDTDSAVSTLHGHHRRVQCLRGQWVDFSVCLDLHSGLSAMNWSDDFLFCVLWAIKGIDTIFISAIAYASQWPNWIIFGQNTLSICIHMQNFGYFVCCWLGAGIIKSGILQYPEQHIFIAFDHVGVCLA